MKGVNLLPETLLAARGRRRRRALWFRVVGGYCLVILGCSVIADGVFVEPVDALQAESLALDSDIAAAEAGIGLLQERAGDLAAEVGVLRDIHGQPDWSVLLGHLSAQLDDRLSLRSVRVLLQKEAGTELSPKQLARGPYLLELTGVAREQSAVTGFVIRLEEAGLLDEVTLKGTSPTRLDGGDGVQFSVTAAISAEGGA